MQEALAYLEKIKSAYQPNANPQNAVHMKRYMKERFEFYGIKTPLREQLSRQVMQAEGIPDEPEVLKQLCRYCFDEPHREMQYFVKDILLKSLRKLDASYLSLIEELIGRKSWWDTVDFLSPKIAGPLLLRYPELIIPYTERWIQAENIWYQRAGLLFQLDYKAQTDAGLLFDYIRQRAGSPEFFVKKAAGWALRQYSRTAPEAVIDFVRKTDLSSLTEREALRWLKNRGWQVGG